MYVKKAVFMNITILDRSSFGEDTPIEMLEELGKLTVYDSTDPRHLISRISDADVLVFNKVKFRREHFALAKSLKLICVFATGYDNIDLDAAREFGVAVCNVPNYSSDSVALFTLATALALVTHLREYNDYVRSGEYTRSGIPNKLTPVYTTLISKTWGIVGCGNIGKRVADIAKAFGARVLVNSRSQKAGYENASLIDICKSCDIISIHCPLNAETRELINREKIAVMKDGVILINESRGAVLSERDVKDAVLSGKIGALGCDVYTEEPFSENHPFYEIKDLDNVLLTPHAAWGSYDSRLKCISIIKENISSFFNGTPQNRVD